MLLTSGINAVSILKILKLVFVPSSNHFLAQEQIAYTSFVKILLINLVYLDIRIVIILARTLTKFLLV